MISSGLTRGLNVSPPLQPAFAYYVSRGGEWVLMGMLVVGVRRAGISSVIRFGARRLLDSLDLPWRIPA
ncbi:MAG: hypothetical protein ACLPV4_21700 [Solirubrobacteraceae bacterium]